MAGKLFLRPGAVLASTASAVVLKLSSGNYFAKIILVSAITESKFAWEPVTPRGVAAFARASLERLLVVQSVFALLAVFAVVRLLADGFFPTVDAAIASLPDRGDIRHGRLLLAGTNEMPPKILGAGHFLAITLDTQNSHALRTPAHFQLEFTGDSLVIISLLGEMEIPYPPDRAFYFNRADLRPAWGAWAPDFLGLAAIGTFFGLLLVWWLLAMVYFLPVWLVGFFTDRRLNFRAAWKLSGAAQMPGALLMSLGLALYALGVFDLVQLAFAFTMHLVISWIYIFVSPMFLDRATAAENKNPFTPSKN